MPGPARRLPGGASSAGRTKSSAATSDETGLPGSPKTSVLPRTPNATGLPGFTATRQKTSSTPSSPRMRRTRSCGPTDTPPDVTRTSAAETAFERGAMRSVVVGDGRQDLDVAAGGGERSGEQQAVRLVHLAGAERLARTPELRSRRQHRDARPPRADDLLQAGRRQCADLRRPDPDAAENDRAARRNVAAAGSDVVSFANVICNLDLVAFFDNVLDRHDGVGAVGNDAPGGDPHGLTRLERPWRGHAGCDLRDDRQPPGSVRRAKRKAVHRRARERRQIDGRTARSRPPRGPRPPQAGPARSRAAARVPGWPPGRPGAKAARP